MKLKLLLVATCASALSVSTAYAGQHADQPVDANENAGIVQPQEFNLDDFAGLGFTWAGKEILDLDGVIGQIDSGRYQQTNANTITYTFLDNKKLIGIYNNPNYGFTAGNGLNPFSEAQRDAARDSIGYWDDLIAPSYVESNGLGADIQFANSADPAQAYAYYPESTSTNAKWKFFGDVFVADPALNWTNAWLNFNGYGSTALTHEIGHSSGLSHPGAYNFDPTIPSFDYANYAEYAQDTEQYSIMSYWSPSETAASIIDWSTFLFGNAQTPMLHDIVVMQSIYGADLTTRTGDTVYGFNSNAGRDVFDFSKNPFPNVSIYDAGGNDTIDLSGFDASVYIDLHDGAFTSAAQAAPSLAEINANRAAFIDIAGFPFGPIGQATRDGVLAGRTGLAADQIAFETGVGGIGATSLFNISIAYGTVIENAVGGSQADLLWGNESANVLNGKGGLDTMVGFAGADTFVFDNADAVDVVVDFTSGEDRIDLSAFGGLGFIGTAAFSSTVGELRYDMGKLQADLDGDGVADLIVELGGAPLAASDLDL